MLQGPRNRMSRIDAAIKSGEKVTNFGFDAAADAHFSGPQPFGFVADLCPRAADSHLRVVVGKPPSRTPDPRPKRSAGVEAQKPDARSATLEVDIGPHIRFGKRRDAGNGGRPPGTHARHGKEDQA